MAYLALILPETTYRAAPLGAPPLAAPPAVRPSTRAGLTPNQTRKVMDFIEAHLDESITNHDLAEVIGVSICHFARLFKAAQGATPREYLLWRRVLMAKQLMVDTTLPLSQIAQVCGFSDQPHMSRTFRRWEPSSPNRWRKLNGQPCRRRARR